VFAEVFERELFGWHTDEAAWPRNRTYTLFHNWFTPELHSVVEDLRLWARGRWGPKRVTPTRDSGGDIGRTLESTRSARATKL